MVQTYQDEQIIDQLEKRKGGYFYLTIPAEVVNQFENKRQTRLICTINECFSFQCGLNHLGDGNFFIIIGSQKMKEIGRKLGDKVRFEVKEDPNPLGVDIPEVLEAMLEQDEELKNAFENLSLGKQRSVIFAIQKIKSIDKQIEGIRKYISLVQKPIKRREL
jgi:Domain of unknown function (DUF1905)/Bacteriocin-protection, YdeI or OmpD-Associated